MNSRMISRADFDRIAAWCPELDDWDPENFYLCTPEDLDDLKDDEPIFKLADFQEDWALTRARQRMHVATLIYVRSVAALVDASLPMVRRLRIARRALARCTTPAVLPGRTLVRRAETLAYFAGMFTTEAGAASIGPRLLSLVSGVSRRGPPSRLMLGGSTML